MAEDENKHLERLHADNREQAKAAWSNADNAVLKGTELAAQIGVQALRAPGFLNAAGIAALLGLLSANTRALKAIEATVALGFVLFMLGAAASAAALGIAYFAQRKWTEELNDHTKSSNHPYVTSNKRVARLTGDRLFAIAATLSSSSFVAFASGACAMLLIIRHIASSAQ